MPEIPASPPELSLDRSARPWRTRSGRARTAWTVLLGALAAAVLLALPLWAAPLPPPAPSGATPGTPVFVAHWGAPFSGFYLQRVFVDGAATGGGSHYSNSSTRPLLIRTGYLLETLTAVAAENATCVPSHGGRPATSAAESAGFDIVDPSYVAPVNGSFVLRTDWVLNYSVSVNGSTVRGQNFSWDSSAAVVAITEVVTDRSTGYVWSPDGTPFINTTSIRDNGSIHVSLRRDVSIPLPLVLTMGDQYSILIRVGLTAQATGTACGNAAVTYSFRAPSGLAAVTIG